MGIGLLLSTVPPSVARIRCISCSASKSNPTDLDGCLKGNQTGSKEEECDEGCATIINYSGDGVYDVEKGCVEGTTKVLFDCLWESCGHQGECMEIRSIHINRKVNKCYKDADDAGKPISRGHLTSGDNNQPSSQATGREIDVEVVNLCQCNHEDHCNEFIHRPQSHFLSCPDEVVPDGNSAIPKASSGPSNAMVAVVIFSGLHLARQHF